MHRTNCESGATPVSILRVALVAMELLDGQAFVDLLGACEALVADACYDAAGEMVRAVEVAREAGVDLAEAAKRFYAIGERLQLGWLRDRLSELESDDKWETIALAGLVMDLRQAQRKLARRYVAAARDGGGEDGRLSVDRFLITIPKLLESVRPGFRRSSRTRRSIWGRARCWWGCWIRRWGRGRSRTSGRRGVR